MHENRLHRSQTRKIIGGVCAGIAEYFHTDPVLIRIIFIFLAWAGGGGVLLYLLLWIFLPTVPLDKERGNKEDAEHPDGLVKEVEKHVKISNRNAHAILGLIIVFAGVMLLADNYLPDFGLTKLWPALIILFGVIVMVGLI